MLALSLPKPIPPFPSSPFFRVCDVLLCSPKQVEKNLTIAFFINVDAVLWAVSFEVFEVSEFFFIDFREV